MFQLHKHENATCSDCGAALFFGTKEEATGWKVYYECGDRCGWEAMAGFVALSDISHQDEVHEKAREMGEKWS
jgi:hypothetical protein